MDKKYRVVFLDVLEGRDGFSEKMSRLGVPAPVVNRILEEAPVVLRSDMRLGEARIYAEALQAAGGKVNIQEDGFFEEPRRGNRNGNIEPLENFTMCPQCGFKQRKAESCTKCGALLKDDGE